MAVRKCMQQSAFGLKEVYSEYEVETKSEAPVKESDDKKDDASINAIQL